MNVSLGKSLSTNEVKTVTFWILWGPVFSNSSNLIWVGLLISIVTKSELENWVILNFVESIIKGDSFL